MRKLTLQQWADEKWIHLYTARIRFKKWLIDWAVKNEFGKIFVHEYKTQEELDIIEYNKIFYDRIKEDARIQKEINDYNNWIIPIKVEDTVKKQPYLKKEKPAIVPSKLKGTALEKENIERTKLLGLPYWPITKALTQAYYWMPSDMSLYLDEYQRTKMTVKAYIDILEAESDLQQKEVAIARWEKYNVPVTIPELVVKEKSQFDIAFDLAEQKEMDYDYLKYFLEKTECPQLMGDEVIIDFLKQYPKKDLETYASDIVIANRDINNKIPDAIR